MKTINKLKKWWRLKTPLFARILQSITGSIALYFIFYESMPERFQLAVPDFMVSYISIGGLITTFLLNFFHVKEK